MSTVELVPWGGVTPIALAQQMAARIKAAKGDVHVIACVIEKNARGNYVYTATCSPMPAEVALMAAHTIKDAALANTVNE